MTDILQVIKDRETAANAELERIKALSDDRAWLEASSHFAGTDAEIFMQIVIALCPNTDLSFWREYRRLKKKVITVHYKKFESDSYQAAVARGWLWDRWVVKHFD
ncbi:MAG: hypothetical protein GYA45_11780 [Pelolinea sp.]|nr:hypothetical protein [Pelolinea sp.]